ncbi:MAG TPA: response regulator transcription factor [Dokdonella sp.]|uniref:response regulator transcription factor n=1 Tax=Dokdonella sp. TaxID=2291710 RepID=UPI002D7EE203|nr:response regulator transcription factor [Dokdonella sp.]HET9032906.1 response regulator transcription factor [Dokdonella sp.]
MKVLIVEDELDIAANIWDFLERRGHVVDHAVDGRQGLARAVDEIFDIIILDLGLPRLDGLELCRRLRDAGSGVPVLMLTARDTLEDCLSGFEHGADDYMVKPFAMRELEARIRVLHRNGSPLEDSVLGLGELSYSSKSMLAERAGQSFPLTVSQGRILSLLIRESPNVIRHETLLNAVWGEQGGTSAALHSHVCTLRALIDRPFDKPMLQTVHGIGYRLVDPA